jgi:hypothetical protein
LYNVFQILEVEIVPDSWNIHRTRMWHKAAYVEPSTFGTDENNEL